jgi:hypothetical protein
MNSLNSDFECITPDPKDQGFFFLIFIRRVLPCLISKSERRLTVFGNRVWRRMFGPKRDKVTEEWRKLHNEELHDLYSSSGIVRVIKSRRMRWAGHVAWMGRR